MRCHITRTRETACSQGTRGAFHRPGSTGSRASPSARRTSTPLAAPAAITGRTNPPETPHPAATAASRDRGYESPDNAESLSRGEAASHVS